MRTIVPAIGRVYFTHRIATCKRPSLQIMLAKRDDERQAMRVQGPPMWTH
jgi:hypothetical protein